MPASIKSLGLDRLSLAERILLVEELWDSIAACPEEFTLSEPHRQDLQRRLDAYRDDPKAGTPWRAWPARTDGTVRRGSRPGSLLARLRSARDCGG